jgi:hypothetical protein
MQDYGLPAPRDAKTELQMERLKYDDPGVRQQLRSAFEQDKATWTAEFHTALATITDVHAKHGGFVVIEGAGGAGKTFLTKGLVNYFRSEGLNRTRRCTYRISSNIIRRRYDNARPVQTASFG